MKCYLTKTELEKITPFTKSYKKGFVNRTKKSEKFSTSFLKNE